MRCNICGKNIDNDKNICSECEKNMKNPKNINNNDIKSLGELLRTTWVYSIITFLITYFLLIFCISNVDFISKFFSGPNGLHYVFLIFLIQFLLVFIYIIKSIKKIIKLHFNNHNKKNIFKNIIVTFIYFYLILFNYKDIDFLVIIFSLLMPHNPYIFLLSSTIVLNIEKKINVSETGEENSIGKDYFSFLYVILTILLVLSKINYIK